MFIQFEAKHMLYKIEGSLYFIKLHVCELMTETTLEPTNDL